MSKPKKKNWIKDAIKEKGALHKSMGVPMGEKLNLRQVALDAMKKGKLGKRARLAITLRGFKHKKK